ncbi:hypothetical protein BDV97DRAFT_369441 [Delphinella strobiligena]|nr:hypothetical protein BDV97DRAFT_369441 [Delphinella strobiligena]
MNLRNSDALDVQPPASPTKEVRFNDDYLFTASRRCTEQEAWTFWWFETHCQECPQCKDPYQVLRHGGHLCLKGEILGRDVALYIFMSHGEIYERLSNRHRDPDRVEIPHGYYNMPRYLMAREEERRERHERRRSHMHVVQLDQGPGLLTEQRHPQMPVIGEDQDPARHTVQRRREDRYYQERYREEKPKINTKHHRSERAEVVVNASRPVEEDRPKSDRKYHRSEGADIIVNASRQVNTSQDNIGRSGRRRHRHSAEYRREDSREARRDKEHVHEDKPMREDRPDKKKTYRSEERRPREHRYLSEMDVEVNGRREEKKYMTEVRKPDKERRKSYHY